MNFKYDVKAGEDTGANYLNVVDESAFDVHGASIFGTVSQIDANLQLPLNQLNISKLSVRTSGSVFPPIGYSKSHNPAGSAGPTFVSVLPEFRGADTSFIVMDKELIC